MLSRKFLFIVLLLSQPFAAFAQLLKSTPFDFSNAHYEIYFTELRRVNSGSNNFDGCINILRNSANHQNGYFRQNDYFLKYNGYYVSLVKAKSLNIGEVFNEQELNSWKELVGLSIKIAGEFWSYLLFEMGNMSGASEVGKQCQGKDYSTLVNNVPVVIILGDYNGDGLQDQLIRVDKLATRDHAIVIFGSKDNSQKPKVVYAAEISRLINQAKVEVVDRNRDGKDDLVLKLPEGQQIAFSNGNGFDKPEWDSGIGLYQGPSLYKSRFCNRALLTQHPDENPSTVLFDDVCRTAYVSPPQFGQAEVTALTPNPEKQKLCPAFVGVLNKKQKVLDDLVSVANSYTENVASLEVDDSLAVYSAAKRKAKKQLTEAEQRESTIRLQLESANLALAEASFALEICGNCSAEQTTVNNAQSHVNQLKQQLNQTVLTRRGKQQAYDKALVTYQQERERLIQLDTELMALLAEYEVLKQKETSLFTEYAAAEGATTQVRYPLNWTAQINSYQQRNTRLGVNWQPLPLTGLKLIARLPEHPETPMGNKNLSLPYVLYANINDTLTGYEPSLMPAGNTVIKSTLRKYSTDPITVPDALTGTVGISVGGYCLLHSEESGQPISNQQIAQQVAPTLHYEYEQQVKRGYTAKYKLDTFVKTIVRTKKKKKWFKKKKKTYIERKVITKDWFDIKFDASNSEYAYSAAEQDQITREVKADLIRRVNTSIGALYADNNQCKANKDCSYGYWFGHSAATNGDTKAIEQFKKGNSKWIEEVVYGVRYRPKAGWMSFK